MSVPENNIPLSTEFAIREAVKLLRASRRNFKSKQVETARILLEKVLEYDGREVWPPQKKRKLSMDKVTISKRGETHKHQQGSGDYEKSEHAVR